MKQINKYGVLLLSLLILNSCQKEDEIIVEPQINTTLEETNEIEYSYGPIVKVSDAISNTKSTKTSATPWRDITKDDLTNLSRNSEMNFLNDSELRSRFNHAFTKSNRKPKNVSINDLRFGGGTNTSEKYGWVAQIRTYASPVTQQPSSLTGFKRVAGTAARSERNNLSYGRTMELAGEWRITTTNESNWNVTGSISTEVGGKIGIPLLAEGSVSVTVSLESGGGGSQSRSITEVINGGSIYVPAGKVANWELVERHRDYKSQWDVPVEFSGSVGADYGAKVEGHYFWSVSANSFFHEYVGSNKKKYIVNVTEEYGKELRIRAWITNN